MSTLVVVLCAMVGTADVSQARDGDLDDSFGVNGLGIVTPWKGGALHGNVMAVQPDGKILVSGSEQEAGEPDSSVVLVRFDSDGSLDTDFGDGGVVIDPIMSPGYRSYSVRAIAVADDGTIVVVGDGETDDSPGFVIRYLANGSLDTSFGDAGLATLDLGGERWGFTAVTVQADGRIVAGGTGNADGGIIARFSPDGSLDQTFGSAGIVRASDAASDSEEFWWSVGAIALQPDGNIVIAGSAAARSVGVVARFGPDGTPDPTFSADGIYTTSDLQDPTLSYTWVLRSLTISPEGHILAGGWLAEEYSPPLPFVLRLGPSGLPDATFPTAGFYPRSGLLLDFATGPEVAGFLAGMLLQPDGKMIIAGESVDYNADGSLSSRNLFIRRFDAEGAPDPTFGNQGLVTLPQAMYPSPGWLEVHQTAGIVVQSDGKIVVECSCYGDAPGPGIVLFRLGTAAGLLPELTTPVGQAGGVTLRVSNYDPAYTWLAESSAGSATIDESGVINVTGLNSGQSAVITVSTGRPGYEAASTSTTGVALPTVLPETGRTSGSAVLAAVILIAVGGAMLALASDRRVRRERTAQAARPNAHAP